MVLSHVVGVEPVTVAARDVTYALCSLTRHGSFRLLVFSIDIDPSAMPDCHRSISISICIFHISLLRQRYLKSHLNQERYQIVTFPLIMKSARRSTTYFYLAGSSSL
jgi:hypothetical protein